MLDKLIQYEQGEMTADEILDLFKRLIDTGLIYELQGHYQRQANRLIREGLLNTSGD